MFSHGVRGTHAEAGGAGHNAPALRTVIIKEKKLFFLKVMIFDQDLVLTGSFNFTRLAETRNAENIVFLRSSSLAAIYIHNWKYHEVHSQRYYR